MHFDALILSKSYQVLAKKLQKSHFSWHWSLKGDVKFKEKLTYCFKYDMRNFVNFHPTNETSEKIFSMGSFCPKYTRLELQKDRGVIFHDTKLWCKIWINLDIVVSKTTWGIGWTFIRALKNLKNCTLIGCFCPRHIMFQLECLIGVMCHNTKGWCKI